MRNRTAATLMIVLTCIVTIAALVVAIMAVQRQAYLIAAVMAVVIIGQAVNFFLWKKRAR